MNIHANTPAIGNCVANAFIPQMASSDCQKAEGHLPILMKIYAFIVAFEAKNLLNVFLSCSAINCSVNELPKITENEKLFRTLPQQRNDFRKHRKN